MSDLPAVRGLGEELEEDGVDLLLVNVHDQASGDLTERYDFMFTPTYVVFDAEGKEVWRSNRRPSQDLVLAELRS